jgi:hypothetical protein
MTTKFKSFLKFFALSSLALGNMHCSKERPTPIGATTSNENREIALEYPIGFSPKRCGVDTSGVEAILYRQARKQAYESGISDEEFDAVKEKILSQPAPELDSQGHVSESVTPYAARVNRFTDGVKEQLDKYNDYVELAASQGYDAQSPDVIKSIITEQFEATIPAQWGDPSLSEQDKAQLKIIADAARPRITQAFELFDALYKCEKAVGRLQGEDKVTGTPNPMTFKQYLQLSKAGKIQPHAAQKITGFWSSLVKSLHVVVTVVVHTVVGIMVGSALAGPAAAGTGALVGGAFGFISGIVNVSKGFCLFGRC